VKILFGLGSSRHLFFGFNESQGGIEWKKKEGWREGRGRREEHTVALPVSFRKGVSEGREEGLSEEMRDSE